MRIELDASEQRVIGSLLEKERTVPDSYPMTLNGLRTACNQTSGREPVLALSEAEVRAALDSLRGAGLTRVLHASHGARVPKFRQVLDEVLTLDDGERAVLTLLLLRGPQTPGELRSRAERLHPFAELAQVEHSLASLASRDEPLVEELPRRPGQKEQRWRHLLGPPGDAPHSPDPAPRGAAAEVEQLRADLDEARREIARLQQELDDLTAPS
ncbi:MAG: YceH family protein [Actinomycetota bacterium]